MNRDRLETFRTPGLRRLCVIAAFACMLLPLVLGQGERIPMERHEAFVARTSEEMIERGDMLVPHFNGEPRINKPPLNYWIAIVVDRIDGADGRVTTMESRVASMFGAAIGIFAAWRMGVLLFGSVAGMFGALLIAGADGVMFYAHSSRPDMLQAGLCTLAASGYVGLYARRSGGSTFLALASIIVGMGGANLSKGPWAPLALFASVVVGVLVTEGRGRVREVARPWLSLLLLIVPFAGWYGMILIVDPDAAAAAWGAEIGERLEPEGGSFLTWFEPYYPVRTAHLAAPWVLLYGVALSAPLWPSLRRQKRVMFMWILVAGAMLAWQVLPGRRIHYALPALLLLGPMWGRLTVIGLRGLRRNVRIRGVVAVQAAAPAVGAFVAIAAAGGGAMKIAAFGGLGVVASVGVVLFVRRRVPGFVAASSSAVASVVLMSMLASFGIGWSGDRWAQRDFALAVASVVDESDRLVAWRGEWSVEAYHLSRVLPKVREIDALADAARDAGGCIYVVSDRPLPASVAVSGGRLAERDRSRLYRLTVSADDSISFERVPLARSDFD